MNPHRLPNRGWPTAEHTKTPFHIEPIVSGATFAVYCACGFGHDSAATTAEEAIKEVAATHQCAAPEFTAESTVLLTPVEASEQRIARLETLVLSVADTVTKLGVQIATMTPTPTPPPDPKVTP